NETYIKDWGAKNDTEVVVDNINLSLIPSRAAAEVSAQQGHDLVMFLAPPSVYEEQVVDMKDVYAECEKNHGKPIDLAVKSTFNPKTKKYFAFSDSFVPDPINYRTDLWGDVGMKPDSWDNIRADGKLSIKSKETLDALRFVKALFQDTMTPEVLAWDASSNNRAMIAGESSL